MRRSAVRLCKWFLMTRRGRSCTPAFVLGVGLMLVCFIVPPFFNNSKLAGSCLIVASVIFLAMGVLCEGSRTSP